MALLSGAEEARLTALGVIAAAIGLCFFLAQMLKNATHNWQSTRSTLENETAAKAAVQKSFDDLTRLNEETREILSAKETELIRELLARKTVEKHRDQLLAELAKSGNPSAVASQIRKELAALATLGDPTVIPPK